MLSVIGHWEFRLLLRQIARVGPEPAVAAPAPPPAQTPPRPSTVPPVPRRSRRPCCPRKHATAGGSCSAAAWPSARASGGMPSGASPIAAAATSFRAAAGGRSGRLPAAYSRRGRLPAADSRRGGYGPRLIRQDGAALLAMLWLGSWDCGPAQWDPGVLARGRAPRWSTRHSMPPRTGRAAAGSCCARRGRPPVADPLLQRDDRNGTSGLHGRTGDTHKHYNRVCLSDYLACA